MKEITQVRLQDIRIYQEAKAEGHREGYASVLLKFLQRQVRSLQPDLEPQVSSLPMPILKKLAGAFPDFEEQVDLETWLEQHPPQPD